MVRLLVFAAVLLGAVPAPQTLVVDLDADHHPDTVVLTQTQAPPQIEITVTYGNPHWRPERFIFTVDPGREDAVCTLPVSLRREGAHDFIVVDNRCDSLHFRWNPKTRHLEWWRL